MSTLSHNKWDCFVCAVKGELCFFYLTSTVVQFKLDEFYIISTASINKILQFSDYITSLRLLVCYLWSTPMFAHFDPVILDLLCIYMFVAGVTSAHVLTCLRNLYWTSQLNLTLEKLSFGSSFFETNKAIYYWSKCLKRLKIVCKPEWKLFPVG